MSSFNDFLYLARAPAAARAGRRAGTLQSALSSGDGAASASGNVFSNGLPCREIAYENVKVGEQLSGSLPPYYLYLLVAVVLLLQVPLPLLLLLVLLLRFLS